jgi:hypothetical protein
MTKPGTVGRAWPGRIKISTTPTASPGQVGTVYMKLGAADFEYYKDKDKTRKNRINNFFTVGDVGYLDPDGYLFLCDRKTDMIISGGVNIYPAEIESEFLSHPKVGDVAVFGIPHEEWGEEVRGSSSQEGVKADPNSSANCSTGQGSSAKYKTPKKIDFIAEMPRDPNGKLASASSATPTGKAASAASEGATWISRSAEEGRVSWRGAALPRGAAVCECASAETPAGFDRGIWKQMAEEIGLHGRVASSGTGLRFHRTRHRARRWGGVRRWTLPRERVIAAHAIQLAATAAQRAALLPGLASGGRSRRSRCSSSAARTRTASPQPVAATATAASSAADRGADAQNADLWWWPRAKLSAKRASLLVVRRRRVIVSTRRTRLTRKLGEVELVDAAATLGDAGAAWPHSRARSISRRSRSRRSRSRYPAVSDGGGLRQVAHPVRAPDRLFWRSHKTAEVMLSWSRHARRRTGRGGSRRAQSRCGFARRERHEPPATTPSCAAAENVHIHGVVGFTWS